MKRINSSLEVKCRGILKDLRLKIHSFQTQNIPSNFHSTQRSLTALTYRSFACRDGSCTQRNSLPFFHRLHFHHHFLFLHGSHASVVRFFPTFFVHYFAPPLPPPAVDADGRFGGLFEQLFETREVGVHSTGVLAEIGGVGA